LADINIDAAAGLIEADDAIDQSEQRPIFAGADVHPRTELAAALSNEDVAGDDFLAAKALHATALRVGITAVTGRTLAFLMSHCRYLQAFRRQVCLRLVATN